MHHSAIVKSSADLLRHAGLGERIPADLEVTARQNDHVGRLEKLPIRIGV